MNSLIWVSLTLLSVIVWLILHITFLFLRMKPACFTFADSCPVFKDSCLSYDWNSGFLEFVNHSLRFNLHWYCPVTPMNTSLWFLSFIYFNSLEEVFLDPTVSIRRFLLFLTFLWSRHGWPWEPGKWETQAGSVQISSSSGIDYCINGNLSSLVWCLLWFWYREVFFPNCTIMRSYICGWLYW